MKLFAQIAGWVGAFLVVLAYILVSSKKVAGGSRVYQLMNLAGAIGVGVNASYEEAWPSSAIQVVWFTIAVAALMRSKKFKIQ